MIDILHMSPWPLGGATSYVVHLARALQLAGVRARVLRPGAKRTEAKKRQLGDYGVMYQNVTFEDLQRSDGVPLLASSPTDKELAEQVVAHVLERNGRFVFHDPNEFRIYPHWDNPKVHGKVICIREAGLEHMPLGEFIPHPYVCLEGHSPATRYKKTKHAVSIARTSAVKNSHWILEANTKLPPPLRVELKGEVNRMWWNFNVKPKHPEWPYPEAAGFPRQWGQPVRECIDYNYMVDLTIFKEDGGGSQYSFLEAMEAGAVPILTKDWCSYPGPAKGYGYQVGGAEELAELLDMLHTSRKLSHQSTAYREANLHYLQAVHSPGVVGPQYAKALGV